MDPLAGTGGFSPTPSVKVVAAPLSNAATSIVAGQRVGELKVAESAGRRLRLVRDVRSDRLLVLVGLVSAGTLVVLAALNLHPAATAPAPQPWMAWLGVLLIVAIAALWVGLPKVGWSYLVDGSSRTLARRWFFLSRTFRHDQLKGVYVQTFNAAGRERMLLGIARDGRRRAIRLARTSTADRQPTLMLAALRISELLGVPLLVAGKPVEASEQVTRALQDTVARGAKATTSPQLLINCPRCGARNVPGLAYDYVERNHGVPILTTSWVKCTACQSQLFSKLRTEKLYGRSPDELADVLVYRAPAALVRRFLALAAPLLGVFPFLGLAVALPAAILNWRQARWAKIASLIGLILGVITTVLGVVALVIQSPDNSPERRRPQPPSNVAPP